MSRRGMAPPEIEGDDPVCSLCGYLEPTAMWAGCGSDEALDVWVCRRCAVETLPKLIADAVAPQYETSHGMTTMDFRRHFLRALREVVAHFWFAADCVRHQDFRAIAERRRRVQALAGDHGRDEPEDDETTEEEEE